MTVKIRQRRHTCTECTNTDSGTYCIFRFHTLGNVNVVFRIYNNEANKHFFTFFTFALRNYFRLVLQVNT